MAPGHLQECLQGECLAGRGRRNPRVNLRARAGLENSTVAALAVEEDVADFAARNSSVVGSLDLMQRLEVRNSVVVADVDHYMQAADSVGDT